jgi:hypothetical protein
MGCEAKHPRICAICDRPHFCRGMCNTHFCRWRRYRPSMLAEDWIAAGGPRSDRRRKRIPAALRIVSTAKFGQVYAGRIDGNYEIRDLQGTVLVRTPIGATA